MNLQNAEFYRLNRESRDIIFNFVNERVIYRKEIGPDGSARIMEYRKIDGEKGKTARELRPDEMTVAEFDAWKAKLLADSHAELCRDRRETRYDVGLEDLSETALACTESPADFVIKSDENRRKAELFAEVRTVLKSLTKRQKRRFLLYAVSGKSVKEIAEQEGCSHQTIYQNLATALRKLRSELRKKGFDKTVLSSLFGG